MIQDARHLSGGEIVDADICIVGTGPAAMSVALSLKNLPVSIVMLEAGGTVREPSTDDDARPSAELQFGTVKELGQAPAVGGNANRWTVRTRNSRRSVRLLPLSDVDFEPRLGIPDSGWPISAADLAGYYRRAQMIFDLPARSYQAEDWEEPWARMLPLRSADVKTGIFQFGDGNIFVETYRKELERSPNVTVLHHATATEALTNESASHVTEMKVATAPDHSIRVRAGCFVIATGGLSSAQILLSSDSVQTEGLGNAHDNVGRYFMDHPLLHGGDFVPSSPQLFEAMTLYDLRSVRGTPVMGYFQLTDEAVRREPILGLSAMVFPRERNYRRHQYLTPRQWAGVVGAAGLRHALWHKQPLSLADAWHAVKGLDGTAKRMVDRVLFPKCHFARGGWSADPRRGQRFACFQVRHLAEQAPHWDNRVRLSRERNRLGVRRLAVEWRWHDEDVAATMRAQEVLARGLEESGLGRFEIAREGGRPVLETTSTAHYMGTTRMHADPRRGVVDSDCRVHGVDNLFIASSSVFPTGSFANPTLTIVALAVRLADRLRALHGWPSLNDDSEVRDLVDHA